jgi:hypothetical protein
MKIKDLAAPGVRNDPNLELTRSSIAAGHWKQMFPLLSPIQAPKYLLHSKYWALAGVPTEAPVKRDFWPGESAILLKKHLSRAGVCCELSMLALADNAL